MTLVIGIHRSAPRPSRAAITIKPARFAGVALAFAILLAGAGCAQRVGYKDIADPNGLYHFKVRSDWQNTLVGGVNLVYASKELPKTEKLADTLTLMVYPSYEATDVPLAEQLDNVIELRAKNRGWRSYERSEPASIAVGGHSGVAVDVSGVDANGAEFDARFYLVRTNDRQVGFLAVAPAGNLKQFDSELDAIVTQRWFWHGPAAKGTTQTP